MKRFGLALFGLGLLLSSLPSCEQWVSTACLKDTEATKETEQPVTMSAVTAADYVGTLPLASISCPDAGEEIKAEHIRAPVAAFLAECDDIRNNASTGLESKVNVAGDTMTDTLTITPTLMNPALVLNAGTNTTAAAINGNGSASALTITAGASNGAIVANANNSAYTIGVSNTGAGGGLSIQAGSTALNVSLNSAPVATAPSYGAQILGGLILIGTPPNADVDPGTNGFVASQNIVTSSAILESDGVGGFAVRNNKGFNVLSWSGDAAGVVTVNFKRNLPGSDYRINVFANDGYRWGWNGVQNVNNYQFLLKVYNTGATIDLTTTAVTIHVSTIGF